MGLMGVGVILKRWIEVLAALQFGWLEAWRARRLLIVSRCAGGYLIRQAGAEREQALTTITAAGTPVVHDVASTARGSLVVLELQPEKVTAQRISVPAKAREFLPGILRNQIDRLSPWPADQAVYGFAADASQEDAASLDVRVMITSRAIIDTARAEIASIGLALDRIVVRAGDDEAGEPVPLWSRVADAPRQGTDRARRLIGLGIAGCVGLSLALTVWAIVSAASFRDQSDDMETRIKALQRQLQGVRTAPATATLDPAEGAWIAKQTAPSTVVLLEALSQALPDAAYLTDLQFERATVRIIGLAADAPSLIAPLEQSGHFTGVHFFAPTTRGSDVTLYRFHIEAQVEPRLEIQPGLNDVQARQ
jgi:general secretion pathway protein L